jgi:drug/metabolite transporter (DMT)-like permease
VAILLGVLIAGETLRSLEIISAMIIIAGVILITTARTLSDRKLPRVPLIPGED